MLWGEGLEIRWVAYLGGCVDSVAYACGHGGHDEPVAPVAARWLGGLLRRPWWVGTVAVVGIVGGVSRRWRSLLCGVGIILSGLGWSRGGGCKVVTRSRKGKLDFFFGQVFGGEEGSALVERSRGYRGVLQDWRLGESAPWVRSLKDTHMRPVEIVSSLSCEVSQATSLLQSLLGLLEAP